MKKQLRAYQADAPLLDTANYGIDTLSVGQLIGRSNLPAPIMPLLRPQLQGFLILRDTPFARASEEGAP